METFSRYLGDRLGWFSELAAGPLTPAELSLRTQTNEHYVVEWLEMQAVYGNLLVVGDGAGVRRDRRYALPDGLSSTPSAATGTVMRRSVLTEYAIRAGFGEVEILPIGTSASSGFTGSAEHRTAS